LPNRRYKVKYFRSLELLCDLDDVARQYTTVFPEHVEKSRRMIGQNWNPTAGLCLLASWNRNCNGFQTLRLEGDENSNGFPEEGGLLYEGFLESAMVSDAQGEVFSRYDGIPRLFEVEM
jgi:hypothetical protein